MEIHRTAQNSKQFVLTTNKTSIENRSVHNETASHHIHSQFHFIYSAEQHVQNFLHLAKPLLWPNPHNISLLQDRQINVHIFYKSHDCWMHLVTRSHPLVPRHTAVFKTTSTFTKSCYKKANCYNKKANFSNFLPFSTRDQSSTEGITCLHIPQRKSWCL